MPKVRKHRFPILAKTAIIIFVMSFIIIEIAMTYYSLVMSRTNKQTYSDFADSLSGTIANVIDKDDFNTLKGKVDTILDTIPEDKIVDSECEDEAALETYMAYYDSLYDDDDFMDAFNRIRTLLRTIVQSNEDFDVDCAYLAYNHVYIDENGTQQGLFVYVCDSAPDEDACPPGWLDPVYDINRDVIAHPERGFPAYTTNTSYGYLITAGKNVAGVDRGYAFVDISMDVVRAKQASSIVRLFLYLLITVNLLAVICLFVVHIIFSKPLKRLTSVARSFDNNDPTSTHQKFVDLNVNTHDEIQELTETIKSMEESVVDRINELVEVNDALANSKKQEERMTALAKRDSLTGVGSKTAYDFEVENINEQIKNKQEITFGVVMIDLNYLKNTNDEYGHIAGDEALVRLSNTICLTFKHSPVYRVGGDEFVVILRNGDYDNASALIEEFKERIQDCIVNKKLPKYERISAAIGLGVYIKGDKSVDDVFKRADKEMYICKREMKNEE